MITNSGAVRPAFDNLTWTAPAGAEASYLPGYSNLTVAGTNQTVTGLTEGLSYFFRARAINAEGTSPDSPTGSVITAASANEDINGNGIPDA